MGTRSNSKSIERSPGRSKKIRQKEKKSHYRNGSSDEESERRRRKKDHKSKHKYERKRSKSRERSREKRKEKEKRQQEQKKERERSTSPPKRVDEAEEQKQRKFMMRQVRARLLKLNNLYGDNDSDDEVPPPQPPPPQIQPPEPQPPPSATLPKRFGKRESKWGKTSSAESNLLPIHEPTQMKPEAPVIPPPDEKKLSLELQNSEDHLRLSEDKSIEVEEPHHSELPLEKIEEEQIDPLDQYMQEIEAEAAPQMDLPKKGEKSRVITFEDIVTQPQNSEWMQIEEEKNEEKVKKQFFAAINNLEEIKATQTQKNGTFMENNEQKQSQISDFQQQDEPQLDFFAKQRKLAERKQLGLTDHSKITYEEVKFNLYREADEIKNMDPKLVTKFRKEAGDIKIRGKGVLNPVFNWYQCGFSEHALNVIEKNNYERPFPIQAQSIPIILSGRDTIGIAETGSGKTFAYLLPMLKHVGTQRPVEDGEGPIGLIMTPTRELANQVFMEAKKFCKHSKIRVLAVYGGINVQKQLSDLRKGAEIIICTPGRMIDILTLNKGKITNLRRVSMVVVDEADRMFDLGFEPQITRILENIRPHRQTVMFSATFPKNVQNLAKRILTNPVEILVGSRGQACRNVEQIIEVREETTKFLRLLEILGNWNQKGSILIFVDKQTEADFLFQELIKYGYHTLVLHGAMDPTDRQFTIYDFKKGLRTIMIATSVCARGLDIKQIVLVVNFKCPNHLQDYIHRIGRTGRAGNKGTAITFITPEEEQYSIDLLKALEMSQIHPPEDLIKLSQEFLKKVKKGEARKIRNRNLQGAGFKFDEQEEEKANQVRDMLKKQMKNEGLGFDDSDQDDIETKKKRQEEIRGRHQQERVVEAIKNPEIKNKLLNEAAKAVSEAMKNGSAVTTQKLLDIAVTTMRQSVVKHKVIATVDDGVEQVTKLINQFQNKGNGESIDFFSYDFEINDYPPAARQRACSQHFLHQIQRQNNCTISLRGVEVEPGKKPPVGCRKLYLHIQSEDKSYVSTAYKDIKRVIEEGAFESMHMASTGKYSI